jgi:hypothetical protein
MHVQSQQLVVHSDAMRMPVNHTTVSTYTKAVRTHSTWIPACPLVLGGPLVLAWPRILPQLPSFAAVCMAGVQEQQQQQQVHQSLSAQTA